MNIQENLKNGKLFAEAIKNGDVKFLNEVAGYYNTGKYGVVDHAQEFELDMIAAQKGYGVSQYNTGCSYMDGVGVKEDAGKAFFGFSKLLKKDLLKQSLQWAIVITMGWE